MIKYNNAYRWLTQHHALEAQKVYPSCHGFCYHSLSFPCQVLSQLFTQVKLIYRHMQPKTIPGFRLEQPSPVCKGPSLSQGVYSQLKVTPSDFGDLLLPATTWLHREERRCHAMHGRGQLLSFLTGLWRWCPLALTVHLWDGHKSKGPVALEMNFCSNQEKGPEFFLK